MRRRFGKATGPLPDELGTAAASRQGAGASSLADDANAGAAAQPPSSARQKLEEMQAKWQQQLGARRSELGIPQAAEDADDAAAAGQQQQSMQEVINQLLAQKRQQQQQPASAQRQAQAPSADESFDLASLMERAGGFARQQSQPDPAPPPQDDAPELDLASLSLATERRGQGPRAAAGVDLASVTSVELGAAVQRPGEPSRYPERRAEPDHGPRASPQQRRCGRVARRRDVVHARLL